MDGTSVRPKPSKKKILVFRLVALFLAMFVVATLYAGALVYRSVRLYSYVKSNQRGWTGKVTRMDPQLGFAPIPDSHGAEIFPIGPPLAMRYDKDGFRVPVADNQSSAKPHPLILTLGCSFTYGAAARAEDTYPFLVGQGLGGTTKNAGVSSYGLAQMLILARRLIPQYKPDYVIVQYSPWLASRAVSGFAPSYYGAIPTPFFYEQSGKLMLHPPMFNALIVDLPVDDFRRSPKSNADLGAFAWNVGLRLFIHDDFHMGASFPAFLYQDPAMTLYRIKKFAGLAAENRFKETVEKHVYSEIYDLAVENGSALIVVALNKGTEKLDVPEDLFPGDSLTVVNGQNALLKKLPVIDEDHYGREYWHWRGDSSGPLTLVDTHPNAAAHRIIADEILAGIERTKTRPQREN